jgi:hypothetical protein
MKHLSGYTLLFLAALLSSSCSDNSGSASTDANTLLVSSVGLSGVQTRSITPLTTAGATISVSTINSGVVSATSQYAYTDGVWNTVPGCPGLIAPEGTALCAYYPYTSSITDKSAIPLSSAKYDMAKDLNYAYSTVVTDASNIGSRATFALQHAYARLTFNFSRNNYTGSKSIGDIIISNPGIFSGASLNITRAVGEYSSKVAGDVAFNAGIADFTTTPSARVLMVPTDALSGDINLQIQVGSNYKRLTLPSAFFKNNKLEAGVDYQIAVTVNGESGGNPSGNSIPGKDCCTLTLGSGMVLTTDWLTDEATTVTLNCPDPDPTPDPTPGPTPQPESNCYIVPPGATIYIPVSRASTGNPDYFSTSDTFTTGLLWSDVSATHVTATADGRYIKVVASNTEGNSVVYAKHDGLIVWSWHIWVTNYNPGTTANTDANTTTYSFNNNLWMDRNLGATTTTPATQTTKGLIYQWGRKDPFPGSSTYNGNDEPTLYGEQTSVAKTDTPTGPNLVVSIQNPLTFYYSNSGHHDWYTAGTGTQDNNLWNNTDGAKTIYDPCPIGWRVPYFTGTTSPWNGLSVTGGTWNWGYSWTGTPNIGYYPASSYRNFGNGTLYYVGDTGCYWAATMNGIGAYNLAFRYTGYMNSSDYSSRANGQSVRCVKN